MKRLSMQTRRGGAGVSNIALGALVLAAFASSCDDPSGLTLGPISAMVIVSGDAQSDTVGQQLPNPIIVRAEDANGNALPNQIVNFVVVKGGGSVFAGSNITNAQGVAQELWTLGVTAADSQVVEVRAVNNTTGQAQTFARFVATALASAPTIFTIVSGNNQSANLGAPVANPAVVLLADQHGNPVAGKAVAWSVTAGDGFTVSAQGTTGSDGKASSFWELGVWANITHKLTATVAGFTALEFSATPTLPALTMTKVKGDAQTDTVGLVAADSVVVEVSLADSRKVRNATIAFAAASGSGSVGGASVSTGANGRAGTTWTLGTAAGAQSVTASTSSASNAVFGATAVPNATASVTVSAGNAQSGIENVKLSDSLAVLVTDTHGNPKSGVTVTWTVTSGGGSVAAGATTNSSGIARASWTLGAPGNQGAKGAVGGLEAAFTATAAVAMTEIAVGSAFNCAISTASAAYCWGSDANGQLGTGAGVATTTTKPGTPVTGSNVFTQISAGTTHVCAVNNAGAVYCWGSGASGQIGNGANNDAHDPTLVSGGLTFAQVAAGQAHSCGVTNAGAAYCWGAGTGGALGQGALASSNVPVAVTGGHVFAQVSAGDGFSCGRKSDGTTYCWGTGNLGELGNGSTGVTGSPVQVTGGQLFTTIGSGGPHTCGITSAGAAYCWGYNQGGQLGNGVSGGGAVSSSPVAVSGGHTFTSISGGPYHTCAIRSDNPVLCWGRNAGGQLGTGNTTPTSTPIGIIGGQSFSKLSAGGRITESTSATQRGSACGITTIGAVYCWGETASSSTPTRVWP